MLTPLMTISPTQRPIPIRRASRPSPPAALAAAAADADAAAGAAVAGRPRARRRSGRGRRRASAPGGRHGSASGCGDPLRSWVRCLRRCCCCRRMAFGPGACYQRPRLRPRPRPLPSYCCCCSLSSRRRCGAVGVVRVCDATACQ